MPGVRRPVGHDTATFTNSGSQTSIDLTGVNPNLAALSFSTSNYTLSGGSLTLQSSTGTATVTVSSGTQTIASAVTLASNVSIVPATQLTISGNIGENPAGESLWMDGSGMLILNGADNSYTGGTNVEEGTLYFEQSGAIPYASALNVAAGGTVVLGDPPGAGEYVVARASAAGVASVPEPGTLALLAVAGMVAAAAAWRRRRTK